jgi:hypothetical protein
MNRRVTIIRYHYAHDFERSRFLAIEGLSVERIVIGPYAPEAVVEFV